MRRLKTIVGLAAATVLLAGCSSSTGELEETPSPHPSIPSELPAGSSSQEEMEKFFNSHSWKDKEAVEEARDDWQGMMLHNDDEAVMVLFGSSSCPPAPEVIVEDSELQEGELFITHIILEMKEYGDAVCTADLGPHFTTVKEAPYFSFSPELTVTAEHPYSEETSEIPAFYGTPSS